MSYSGDSSDVESERVIREGVGQDSFKLAVCPDSSALPRCGHFSDVRSSEERDERKRKKAA